MKEEKPKCSIQGCNRKATATNMVDNIPFGVCKKHKLKEAESNEDKKTQKDTKAVSPVSETSKTIDDLGNAHSGWIEPKELKQFLVEKIDKLIKKWNRQFYQNIINGTLINSSADLRIIKKDLEELLGDSK